MGLLNGHFNLRRIFSGGRSSGPGKNLPVPVVLRPSSLIPHPSPARRRAGVTLVELMIALAILTIGVVGLMNSFQFIQQALQSSKNRTLASNLAQEKMQIIKQKNYYQVLVTSDPEHNDTDFAPDVVYYDIGYFPPETITEAGLTYTRYTYVQVANEDSGGIVTLAPNIPDTGMRLITITVVWSQGGKKKKLSVRSLMANPDTVMSNAIFNGQVRDSVSLAPLEGALVNIAENMGWRDTVNLTGQYSINASPGSFTMVVSSTGYFTQFHSVSITANHTLTQDFSLVKIATGSISGTAWLRDHLVVSQVVASTHMAGGDEIEYVELFNPTTWPINIGSSGAGNLVKLKYLGENGVGHDVNEFALTYISTFVAPGRFYLISSSASFTIAGALIAADAVYAASNQPPCTLVGAQLNCIRREEAGAIIISDQGGSVIDKVGWSDNAAGKAAPDKEGTAISLGDGIAENAQAVRMSRPCSLSSNEGRAYDSNSNVNSFMYLTPLIYRPYGMADGAKTVYSGTPAQGAVITASDGVSSSTEAWLTGWCPMSTFTLVNVATGTWTVLLSSGHYMLQNDTVTVLSEGAVYNFPSTTTLTQDVTYGIITGRVFGPTGAPITSPSAIVVSPGGAGSPANASTADGRYRLLVSSGLVDVTANPGSANPNYVSLSSQSIPVEIGEVHAGVDFVLYYGGRISGFVTRDGINALPGVTVAILDSNGLARDMQLSWTDGRFTSICVPTGTYTAEPAIGSLEQAVPSSATVVLATAGAVKFSSTFTITGALGYITGTVKSGGAPIKSGVLIVVTTTTLTGSPPAPPALSSATLAGPPYYIVSSMEDGTYRAEVRQSTSPKYNVYAYYPSPSGSVATIVSSATSNISVLAGQTTTGVDFSW